MAQSTTNLGKIHVFPSETLYNQFKDIIADNDLALLKDDGAYIIAANLAQNGYVKFSNGLILQWGVDYGRATGKQINYPIAFSKFAKVVAVDGFNASSRYSKAVLYEEPSLAYFKFTYDAETAFVNYIAIGI